jgi:hypothetical protein
MPPSIPFATRHYFRHYAMFRFTRFFAIIYFALICLTRYFSPFDYYFAIFLCLFFFVSLPPLRRRFFHACRLCHFRRHYAVAARDFDIYTSAACHAIIAADAADLIRRRR